LTLAEWKARVSVASGGLCAACRNKPISEFDHIIARSLAPELIDEPSNQLPVCRECHERKERGELTWGRDGGILWIEGEGVSVRRHWPPTDVAIGLLSHVNYSTNAIQHHAEELGFLDDQELLDYVAALREHEGVTYHLQCLALAEGSRRNLYGDKMMFYRAAAEETRLSVRSVQDRTKVGAAFGERLMDEEVQNLPEGHLVALARAEKPLEALDLALAQKAEKGTYTLQEMSDDLHLKHREFCHFWSSEEGTNGTCLVERMANLAKVDAAPDSGVESP